MMELKLYKNPTSLLEKYLREVKEDETPIFLIDGKPYFYSSIKKDGCYTEEILSFRGLVPVYTASGSEQYKLIKQLIEEEFNAKVVKIEKIEYTEL